MSSGCVLYQVFALNQLYSWRPLPLFHLIACNKLNWKNKLFTKLNRKNLTRLLQICHYIIFSAFWIHLIYTYQIRLESAMLKFILSKITTNNIICLEDILLDCFVCGRCFKICLLQLYLTYIVDFITFLSIFISGKSLLSKISKQLVPFGVLPVFVIFILKRFSENHYFISFIVINI